MVAGHHHPHITAGDHPTIAGCLLTPRWRMEEWTVLITLWSVERRAVREQRITVAVPGEEEGL